MEEFKKIYIKHFKEVQAFLMKLCGDSNLAEELTQSTFVTVFEKLDQFKGECKLSVWICQIAKYKYYEYYRKQKRFVEKAEMEKLAHPHNIEERFIDESDRNQILSILHNMPEPYKEVFTLKVMGEVSYKDISQLFGKTESWARVTFYRAKAMIVEKMRGDHHEKM